MRVCVMSEKDVVYDLGVTLGILLFIWSSGYTGCKRKLCQPLSWDVATANLQVCFFVWGTKQGVPGEHTKTSWLGFWSSLGVSCFPGLSCWHLLTAGPQSALQASQRRLPKLGWPAGVPCWC